MYRPIVTKSVFIFSFLQRRSQNERAQSLYHEQSLGIYYSNSENRGGNSSTFLWLQNFPFLIHSIKSHSWSLKSTNRYKPSLVPFYISAFVVHFCGCVRSQLHLSREHERKRIIVRFIYTLPL